MTDYEKLRKSAISHTTRKRSFNRIQNNTKLYRGRKVKKINIDGYFINTYYDENGVDFIRACWILNGRYYAQYYDAKTDTTHKIKRISARDYMSEYEYKNNL